MLTMIAETMLPEAYFKGGSAVGMSTLMGVSCCYFFKDAGIARLRSIFFTSTIVL
jgi:hypothetical protein